MNDYLRAALGAVLMAMASLVAAAQGSLVDELMQKSGIDGQIEQVPAQFIAGMQQAQSQGQTLPEGVFTKLTAVMQRVFDTAQLHADTREQLAAQMSDSDIEAVLKWLGSPLGQRITVIEASAPVEADMQSAIQKLMQDEKRMAMIDEFDAVVRVTDATLNIVNNMQITLTTAMMAQLPQEQRVPVEALQQMVAQNEAKMRALLEPQIRMSLLYTYRELSDAELQRYIDFANTAAGKHYHAASIDALGGALVKASQRFADELVVLFDQQA